MMISQPINPAEFWLDFEAFPAETITLSREQVDQAVELSQQVPNQTKQWQTYLNALAAFAFEHWLAERTDTLTFNQEISIIFPSALNNVVEAVCNLEINQFKLCLIATGSYVDEQVILPRAVIDLPEFIPHFYVLVKVQEEQETALISGFLSYQQLQERLQKGEIEADEDWTYELPSTWFAATPDRLLLYLRCLESSAITLPAIPDNRLASLSQIQEKLLTLLPQLKSPEQELWEILTWEWGTIVLTSPELLHWVYELQCGKVEFNISTHLSDLLQLITQPVMNVGRWLGDELDEIAQKLSWQLLPDLAPTALRSPTEELDAIVHELQHNGVAIPSEARGAYCNIILAGCKLRLYAITWLLASQAIADNLATVGEWTLLLVLGTPLDRFLPSGVYLRVSDGTGILFERQIQTQESYPYFFTRVIGSWEEKFLVTVGRAPDVQLILPPFGFIALRPGNGERGTGNDT